MQKAPVKVERLYIYTYDRDIVCLPCFYARKSKVIPIPRDRDEPSSAGLVGKISLTSDMSEEAIFNEIRNVFRDPMRGSTTFAFEVLQSTGGSSKYLTIPAVSSTFKWSACSIVPKNTKMPIYTGSTSGIYMYITMYIIIIIYIH